MKFWASTVPTAGKMPRCTHAQSEFKRGPNLKNWHLVNASHNWYSDRALLGWFEIVIGVGTNGAGGAMAPPLLSEVKTKTIVKPLESGDFSLITRSLNLRSFHATCVLILSDRFLNWRADFGSPLHRSDKGSWGHCVGYCQAVLGSEVLQPGAVLRQPVLSPRVFVFPLPWTHRYHVFGIPWAMVCTMWAGFGPNVPVLTSGVLYLLVCSFVRLKAGQLAAFDPFYIAWDP